MSFAAIGCLLTLLVFPVFAALRLARSIDYRFILGYALIIFVTTYLSYRQDKKKAEAGEWRIPESTLHCLELFGGWPAAFLGQRTLRHKISKVSYQVTFWMIVALHEAITFDFLHGWQYSRKFLSSLIS